MHRIAHLPLMTSAVRCVPSASGLCDVRVNWDEDGVCGPEAASFDHPWPGRRLVSGVMSIWTPRGPDISAEHQRLRRQRLVPHHLSPGQAAAALPRRRRPVFARLFAPRCTPPLSHLSEAPGGTLNCVCYMWWDEFPSLTLPGDPDHDALHAAERGPWRASSPCRRWRARRARYMGSATGSAVTRKR